jgi:hypothetical protein
MLENAISGNYQTVFPPKNNGFNNKKQEPKTQAQKEKDEFYKGLDDLYDVDRS